MFPFYIWLFILCQKLHPDFSYEPGSNTTKQPKARNGASGRLLFPCLIEAFHKSAIKSPQNIIQKLPDTPRAKPLAAISFTSPPPIFPVFSAAIRKGRGTTKKPAKADTG